MDRRKTVGLNYNYNENWIGGTYYIENLIHALNTLPEIEKPVIYVITNGRKAFRDLKKKTLYPYLKFQISSGENNMIFHYINRVLFKLLKVRLFSRKICPLDAVFPFYDCEQYKLSRKKIYWIPDFQEHFIPEFFNQKEIAERKNNQAVIQESSLNLILSSRDALEHFKVLYPKYKVKTSVLSFTVSHQSYSHLDIKALLRKYDLPNKYFICPNQFWKHKNQFVVLKAVTRLKKGGANITVAFTGKPYDYRHPDYYDELIKYATNNQIGTNIKFLGFIDRAEQLQLMNHSIAVIQPSLFEGWSTVVEDAKSMNKCLIISNINIHKEQLQNSSAVFFDPLNEIELSEKLHMVYSQQRVPALYEEYDYKMKIEEFGRNFIGILNEV